MTNQADSGALEREHVTASHMQEASANQQNVGIPDYQNEEVNACIRQWQEAYQNLDAR